VDHDFVAKVVGIVQPVACFFDANEGCFDAFGIEVLHDDEDDDFALGGGEFFGACIGEQVAEGGRPDEALHEKFGDVAVDFAVLLQISDEVVWADGVDVNPVVSDLPARAEEAVEEKAEGEQGRGLGRHEVGHGVVDDVECVGDVHAQEWFDNFGHEVWARGELNGDEGLLGLAFEECGARVHEFALQDGVCFDAFLDFGGDACHGGAFAGAWGEDVKACLCRLDDVLLNFEAGFEVVHGIGDEFWGHFRPVDARDVAPGVAQEAREAVAVKARLPDGEMCTAEGFVEFAAAELRMHDGFCGGLAVFDVEFKGVKVEVGGFVGEAKDGIARQAEGIIKEAEFESALDDFAAFIEIGIGLCKGPTSLGVVAEGSHDAVGDALVPFDVGQKTCLPIHAVQERDEGKIDVVAICLDFHAHAFGDDIQNLERHDERIIVPQRIISP